MRTKYQILRGLLQLTSVAVLVALVGCRSIQREPVRYVKQEWSRDGFTGRELTTEHFTIISTLHDVEFEEALPTFLEAAFEQYEATLRPPPNAQGRLTMYLFATRGQWAQFAQRHFPARYPIYARIRSGGFTEGDASVLFFVTRAATLATLTHEGWHQYVGRHFQSAIPAWLNEGLACYHEAVRFVGSEPEFTPHRNTFRLNSLRAAIQGDDLLTLDQLVRTDAGEVIGGERARATERYYAQAWALIHFLRHGAGGRYAQRFEAMLRDIVTDSFRVRVSAAVLESRDASEPSTGVAAFRAYFGCEPNDLTDEYYNHVIQLAGF